MSNTPTTRLTVDRDACVGIGQCEVLEPDAFEVDDEGVAVALGPLPVDRARIVVERCPSGAISIVES